MDQTNPPEPPKEDRRNALYVNQEGRSFMLKIYDDGEDSMAKAIGYLDMAKDQIKYEISRWKTQDAQHKGILVPSRNGKNGGLNVH